MILIFLLAVQAGPTAGYTPREERAVMAAMECFKTYVDAVPRRDRRRRGEALFEEAFNACAGEAALRSLLRTRFDERLTSRLLEIVRDVSRDGMRRYIRR